MGKLINSLDQCILGACREIVGSNNCNMTPMNTYLIETSGITNNFWGKS